jgi:hypothetical protein
MKDEIIDNIKADLLYCYEDSYSTKEEYERELDYITNLQDRIDKAIEILENHDHEYVGATYSALNILKGE